MEDCQRRVMISYQWNSKDDALKLYDALTEYGFNVWIDVKKMSGDIYQRMSEGVNKSSVFLLCMTLKYEKSDSCNKEFKFATVHIKSNFLVFFWFT